MKEEQIKFEWENFFIGLTVLGILCLTVFSGYLAIINFNWLLILSILIIIAITVIAAVYLDCLGRLIKKIFGWK